MGEPRIPTNLRMLLILEVMSQAAVPMTPTEINARIGLPKQTAHRLCATLEAEGFLMRSPDGKRLEPSRRLMDIGAGLLQSTRFHTARHQILEQVAAAVKETVNYVVPQASGMHYLDRVDTDWPFRIQLPVGTSVPFHCTASGKTFMASLPPAQRRAFVAGLDLKPLTAHTHRTAEALLVELKEIAKRGYALDNEEFMDGMVALAVPICDPGGRYVASLAFHGPSQRLSVDAMLAQRGALTTGATRLRDMMFPAE
ncbi:MAG: IclR family transcriptional regulator [Pseudomonadota bacterium]